MVHANYWSKGICIQKANQHVQVSGPSTQGSYHSPQLMVALCYPRCRLGSWSSTAVQSLPAPYICAYSIFCLLGVLFGNIVGIHSLIDCLPFAKDVSQP